MMAIVDPFATPATSSGIVDPFATPKSEREPTPAWADVPAEAVKHFLPNVGEVAKGIGGVALKNIETYAPYGPNAPAKAMIDIGRSLYNDPTKYPRAMLSDLAEKYGGEENLRRSLAFRPAEVALDALSMAAPIEGAVGKIGEIGRAADVSKPFYEGLPREPPPATPPPVPRGPSDQAMQELEAAGRGIDIPRALTYQDRARQAGSVALSKLPWVGAPLDEAVRGVPKQIGAQVENIAGEFSPALPENIIGGGIEQRLTGAAEREAAAEQAKVEAANQAAQQKFESEQGARRQAIEDRQTQVNDVAQRAFGDVAPMEMAQDTINDVQSAHRQARDRKDRLYEDVNNVDARVQTSAFSDLRGRAERALSDAGVAIDDPGSNAAKMLTELDRLSGKPGELPANVPPRLMQALQREYGEHVPASVLEQAGFPGGTDAVPPDFRLSGAHAPPPGADAISVQGLEQLSKRIGRMGMDAATPSDRMASAIVKRAFDDWRNDALGSHLTADSAPNARGVIDTARAAHRDLMERFGYNYSRLPEGEPRRAAKLLNQIVTEGTGPEALRDNLIGAKPGNRPVSAPLYEAISNAVPNAAAFRNRLRGAYWNSVNGGAPSAIARKVEGLTPTRMGSHLFEPHEHDLMRGVADIAQRTPEEITALGKEKPPKPVKAEPGRAEQLATRVLGRNRGEEQVLGVFDSAIRQGGKIKEAARIWGKLSTTERNEVRGNWLRNLGGGGEDFSVAKFVTNWNDYSDQAKSFMLDREHRRNLDNFHTVAKNYQDTLARYGNPSQTAQMTAWHKLIAGGLKAGVGVATGTTAFFHPIGMAIAGLGLRKLSRILATPEGARDISRWSRVAQSYKDAPSASKAAALTNLTRSLNGF
jgi:hypothetical protein